MSKAILIMDMPENCMECPMCNGCDECVLQSEDRNVYADTWDELKDGCPIRELPERKETVRVGMDYYNHGWNACLDAIERCEKPESED